MNSLFSHPVLKRVPLVRYSALTKRENKIQVQLLKDFPQYGQKGEIIEVLPGLMRNRLYPKNGACYIIPKAGQGPRIPVVKKDLRAQQQQQLLKQQQQQEAQKKASALAEELENKKKAKESQKIEPVELQGLLFNLPSSPSSSSPETTSATKPSSSTIRASTGKYSLITLNVRLGTLRFSLSESTPVTKSLLVARISEVSGLTMPEADLTLTAQDKSKVDEITSEGSYTLTITQEGSQSLVTKKIVVVV